MEQGKPGLWIGAAVALAVVIVALSIPRQRESAPVVQPSGGTARREAVTPSTPAPGGTEQGAGTSPRPSTDVNVQEASPRPPAGSSTPVPTAKLPAQLPPLSPNVNRESVVQALDNVQFAIRDHRTALGGNPVGTNVEITNALFGDNLKQIRQPMPDGSRINGNGELCDPWGTPYFFHQQSAQKMEVRSAGPDLELWTGDDILQ
jgi:hypothetical protein